jgi:hypothetical protein
MNGANNDPINQTNNNNDPQPNVPVKNNTPRRAKPLRATAPPPNVSVPIVATAPPPNASATAKLVALEPDDRPTAKLVALEPDDRPTATLVDLGPSGSAPSSFFQRVGESLKGVGTDFMAAATFSLPSFSGWGGNDDGEGPAVWGAMNALSFIVLTILIALALCYVATHIGNVQHVKKHWKHYRCQPAYMPFAGFYGFNTADNFEFCMKNIFESNSGDVTSSFGSVLGMFTTIIGVIMEAVNALRTSIATMGGGINVIFQDFTDRIKTFFFQIQVSAMRIKMLIGRMYAIMFAVLYMGMSSLTAGMNFGNTVLFDFLDTFCFPPETPIHVKGRGVVPLAEVRVGDTLLPGGSRVTGKFHFAAAGQPMVRLGETVVSTNHYVKHDGHWKKAADHPDAVPLGPYDRQSLVCLNTDTHTIPIGGHVFRDYDETNTADTETMRFVESRINGTATATAAAAANPTPYTFTDSNTGIQRSTRIKLKGGAVKAARNLQLGDELSTGSKVVGIVHRQQTEFCCVPVAGGKTEFVSPGTLLWNAAQNKWVRAGELHTPFRLKSGPNSPLVFLSFIVTPNSQLELESGLTVRDYMELCSPDTEAFYARDLQAMAEENA